MKLEDYSKYYIQGSDHYLIPKDIFIELFEEMINWKQENQQLKEEFDRMFAIYHSRKLIKKFNDEYDEEDKMKNPNRDYACVCPDAEEVYKRYYELKEQLKQKEDIINKAREYITSYESISEIEGLNNTKENKKLDEKTMNEMIRRYMNVHDKTLEILDNKGE